MGKVIKRRLQFISALGGWIQPSPSQRVSRKSGFGSHVPFLGAGMMHVTRPSETIISSSVCVISANFLAFQMADEVALQQQVGSGVMG